MRAESEKLTSKWETAAWLFYCPFDSGPVVCDSSPVIVSKGKT